MVSLAPAVILPVHLIEAGNLRSFMAAGLVLGFDAFILWKGGLDSGSARIWRRCSYLASVLGLLVAVYFMMGVSGATPNQQIYLQLNGVRMWARFGLGTLAFSVVYFPVLFLVRTVFGLRSANRK